MTIPTRPAAILVAACAALACSEPPRDDGPGAGPGPDSGPREATPLAGTAGVTAFAQTVERGPDDASDLGEVFPGQSNTWVLGRDFSLASGFGGQYVQALALYLRDAAAPATHDDIANDLIFDPPESFPADQRGDEIAFLSPLFGAVDGVRTVAVSDGAFSTSVAPISVRSAFLNGTSGSRLSRTLALPGDGPYALEWSDAAVLLGGLDPDAGPPHAPLYQVVLRDPVTDELLATLSSTTSSLGEGTRSRGLPEGLPAEVKLAFELRSAAGGYAVVDDVVLRKDGVEVEGVATDFDDGALGPWSANVGAESQNVRSGSRDVAVGGSSLRVTRTFYAPPAAAWARLVDVFENPGTEPVSASAVYVTTLGGYTPNAVVRSGGSVVVGWDGDRYVRDVGLVLGSGTALVADGSHDVYLVHPITVPAGGRVALAHFVVQLGAAEGGLTAAEADVPAGTDDACAAIAAGFPSEDEYALDLEPGVLEAVVNF